MGLKSKSSIFFFALILYTIKSSFAAQYGDACHTDGDCDKGFTCSGTCGCFSTKYMFYDDELKMCFSLVGQKCTRNDEDGLIQLPCVPNAECKKSPKLPAALGYCTCKLRYKSENSGKHCASNFEKETPKVTSMDQVRPEGWNRGRGSSTMFRSEMYQYQCVLIGFTTLLLSIFPFR